MANFFNPTGTAQPLVSATSEPHGLATLAPSAQKLGWLKQRELSKHRQEAQVAVEKEKTSALEKQATATVALAAQMQGGLIRAELARHHGEALAAVGAVMFDNYKAMVLEQGSSRQAGTMANIQVHNEHVADALARAARSEITQEQAHVALQGAQHLLVQTEGRIDSRHAKLAEATDRNFDAAFAPISNGRN